MPRIDINMKTLWHNILLLSVLWTTSAFALNVITPPVVLDENIHRNYAKDSVYTIRFESGSEFWQANNFTFRLKAGALLGKNFDSGARVIAYVGDSIGYAPIDFVFGGFFDNKAVYGKTFDWLKPETANDYDGGTMKAFDLYRLMLRYTSSRGGVVVGLGKDYYNFGPGHIGGMLLSDYNMGFTGLYQQYKLWGFTIYGLSAQLNSEPWGNDNQPRPNSPETILLHRFLAYGRIEYYRERWGFALSQAEIYSGNGRSFELQYMIPVFIYHYAQISNWRYGNNGEKSLGALDAYANFFDRQLKIYGELLVDDFQGDRDDASQSVQNCLGFIAGTEFDIPKIVYGFAEAGQINSYVYNHVHSSLKYMYKNAFIGSPLGPDNQIYWGKLGYDFSKINLKTEIYGWLLRQGERDIHHTIQTMKGTRKDKIPFGNVQRETATWLSVIYTYKHNTAQVYTGISKTETENVSGTSKITPFFGFSINGAIAVGWDKK
jgi:hypothetical protein